MPVHITPVTVLYKITSIKYDKNGISPGVSTEQHTPAHTRLLFNRFIFPVTTGKSGLHSPEASAVTTLGVCMSKIFIV